MNALETEPIFFAKYSDSEFKEKILDIYCVTTGPKLKKSEVERNEVVKFVIESVIGRACIIICIFKMGKTSSEKIFLLNVFNRF